MRDGAEKISDKFSKLSNFQQLHITLEGTELAVFRTRICQQHQNGFCKNSDRCPHSHCQTWQRRNPNEYFYLPELCNGIKFIKRQTKMTLVRRCSLGKTCTFSHSKEEELYHPSIYKTKMCTFHPCCTRYYCPFAHTKQELREPENWIFLAPSSTIPITKKFDYNKKGAPKNTKKCTFVKNNTTKKLELPDEDLRILTDKSVGDNSKQLKTKISSAYSEQHKNLILFDINNFINLLSQNKSMLCDKFWSLAENKNTTFQAIFFHDKACESESCREFSSYLQNLPYEQVLKILKYLSAHSDANKKKNRYTTCPINPQMKQNETLNINRFNRKKDCLMLSNDISHSQNFSFTKDSNQGSQEKLIFYKNYEKKNQQVLEVANCENGVAFDNNLSLNKCDISMQKKKHEKNKKLNFSGSVEIIDSIGSKNNNFLKDESTIVNSQCQDYICLPIKEEVVTNNIRLESYHCNSIFKQNKAEKYDLIIKDFDKQQTSYPKMNGSKKKSDRSPHQNCFDDVKELTMSSKTYDCTQDANNVFNKLCILLNAKDSTNLFESSTSSLTTASSIASPRLDHHQLDYYLTLNQKTFDNSKQSINSENCQYKKTQYSYQTNYLKDTTEDIPIKTDYSFIDEYKTIEEQQAKTFSDKSALGFIANDEVFENNELLINDDAKKSSNFLKLEEKCSTALDNTDSSYSPLSLELQLLNQQYSKYFDSVFNTTDVKASRVKTRDSIIVSECFLEQKAPTEQKVFDAEKYYNHHVNSLIDQKPEILLGETFEINEQSFMNCDNPSSVLTPKQEINYDTESSTNNLKKQESSIPSELSFFDSLFEKNLKRPIDINYSHEDAKSMLVFTHQNQADFCSNLEQEKDCRKNEINLSLNSNAENKCYIENDNDIVSEVRPNDITDKIDGFSAQKKKNQTCTFIDNEKEEYKVKDYKKKNLLTNDYTNQIQGFTHFLNVNNVSGNSILCDEMIYESSLLSCCKPDPTWKESLLNKSGENLSENDNFFDYSFVVDNKSNDCSAFRDNNDYSFVCSLNSNSAAKDWNKLKATTSFYENDNLKNVTNKLKNQNSFENAKVTQKVVNELNLSSTESKGHNCESVDFDNKEKETLTQADYILKKTNLLNNLLKKNSEFCEFSKSMIIDRKQEGAYCDDSNNNRNKYLSSFTKFDKDGNEMMPNMFNQNTPRRELNPNFSSELYIQNNSKVYPQRNSKKDFSDEKFNLIRNEKYCNDDSVIETSFEQRFCNDIRLNCEQFKKLHKLIKEKEEDQKEDSLLMTPFIKESSQLLNIYDNESYEEKLIELDKLTLLLHNEKTAEISQKEESSQNRVSNNFQDYDTYHLKTSDDLDLNSNSLFSQPSFSPLLYVNNLENVESITETDPIVLLSRRRSRRQDGLSTTSTRSSSLDQQRTNFPAGNLLKSQITTENLNFYQKSKNTDELNFLSLNTLDDCFE